MARQKRKWQVASGKSQVASRKSQVALDLHATRQRDDRSTSPDQKVVTFLIEERETLGPPLYAQSRDPTPLLNWDPLR